MKNDNKIQNPENKYKENRKKMEMEWKQIKEDESGSRQL